MRGNRNQTVSMSDYSVYARKLLKDEMSALTLRKQYDRLNSQEAISTLGMEYCRQRRGMIEAIRLRIMDLVPSDAWYDAVYEHGDVFPPQDKFRAVDVEEWITAVAFQFEKAGYAEELILELIAQMQKLLKVGVDERQMIARPTGRMQFSRALVRSDDEDMDDHGHPLTRVGTRRLTPPHVVRDEDRLDLMSVMRASYYDYPASPSALAIQRIEIKQGRVVDEAEQAEKRQKRREIKEKRLQAAKEKAAKKLGKVGS